MKRHLVDTPEGQLHFRSAGDLDSDRTVLFFHQSPSSSRMWTGVMEELAADGIGSLAGDMFDYGMSDNQSSQLDLARHASLLVEAALSVSRCRLVAVGHHTGAVMAAAATAHEAVEALMVMGYPLYSSWREKYERLGGRIGPDRFSSDGSELADLWAKLNSSIEGDTGADDRYTILVDRLLAGPLWYTAYAALLQADLDFVLRRAVDAGTPVRTVFAHDDAISRFAPGVTELTGVEPNWIDGGPWVTIEHPDRVAHAVRSFLGELP